MSKSISMDPEGYQNPYSNASSHLSLERALDNLPDLLATHLNTLDRLDKVLASEVLDTNLNRN